MRAVPPARPSGRQIPRAPKPSPQPQTPRDRSGQEADPSPPRLPPARASDGPAGSSFSTSCPRRDSFQAEETTAFGGCCGNITLTPQRRSRVKQEFLDSSEGGREEGKNAKGARRGFAATILLISAAPSLQGIVTIVTPRLFRAATIALQRAGIVAAFTGATSVSALAATPSGASLSWVATVSTPPAPSWAIF